ncbi:MAG: hypothetical protein JXL97_06835 [Bacteroidales bacterium]|nr:hypothetical protein [Bacteroidales bacterium]
MKQIIFLTGILFLMLSCSSQNSKNESMELKLPKIGMEFSQFSTEFPEVVNNETNGNRQYGYETQIQGLDGGWAYDFKDNKLIWFMYNSYNDQINQANFDKYLEVTQSIIAEFKQKYGEPTELEFENKTFIDPYIEHHWGYDVIKAVWRTPEMDFEISFDFMGGKGEYNFIFKMEFHESGYEYF